MLLSPITVTLLLSAVLMQWVGDAFTVVFAVLAVANEVMIAAARSVGPPARATLPVEEEHVRDN